MVRDQFLGFMRRIMEFSVFIGSSLENIGEIYFAERPKYYLPTITENSYQIINTSSHFCFFLILELKQFLLVTTYNPVR